jgi:hypothetical protein
MHAQKQPYILSADASRLYSLQKLGTYLIFQGLHLFPAGQIAARDKKISGGAISVVLK